MCPIIFFFAYFTLFLITFVNHFSIAHFLPMIHEQEHEEHPIWLPEECYEKCGSLRIPFPFFLNTKTKNNTTCGSSHLSDAFRLTCLNSSSLYLAIGLKNYRVLRFLPDGILLDFPNTSLCHHYNDLESFNFSGNEYFGISADNVLSLYDCEDSSLCKTGCESSIVPGCDDYGGDGEGGGGRHPSCCYPLFDHSAWHFGDSFLAFSQFGCRGFSSSIVLSSSKESKRGVKLEWGIPENSFKASCASNADIINATSVRGGMRCQCRDGFVGDGFSTGLGCLKSCLKDGKAAYGKDCYSSSSGKRRTEIIAGVLTSAFTLTSLTAMLCLLKRPMKSDALDSDYTQSRNTTPFGKVHRSEPFTYLELEQATKGFNDGLKLLEGPKGALYAGTLADGSRIAVHKVQCEGERDLIQVLSRVEILSSIAHKNMARLLGWFIDSCYTPLVLYEYPANGSLEKNLAQAREQKVAFDWYRRLNVATETASILAFLQYEVSPPIFHQNLQSGCIFLDEDMSSKISGFELLNSNVPVDNCQTQKPITDVYNLGLVLLELITGSRSTDLATIGLQKIRSGKLEEIVDPGLYYHERPGYRREQIEMVADLATRCLLYGVDGKLGMADVAKELANITKESLDVNSRRGPALEETFSNSSLLQMISMSPDSLHVK